MRQSGEIAAEGVIRRGPARLRLRLEARIRDEGGALALQLSGRLQHVIRFSGMAVATPAGHGSDLQCSMRLDGLPQSVHLALAGAEHRAVRIAAAAVEACAAAGA